MVIHELSVAVEILLLLAVPVQSNPLFLSGIEELEI